VYYPYYYGTNIVRVPEVIYVEGARRETIVVYVDGERAGTSEEFYGQAKILANTVAPSDVTVRESADDWLALGTFSLRKDGGETDTGLIFQLAADKTGQIRGNLVNEDDEVWQVFGAVDTETQRVALRLADDDELVYECGLWNLTQDTVPMLVHFDAETTEQRTLIRLVNPDEETPTGSPASATPTLAP